VDFWLGGFFVGCFFCWVDLLLGGLFVGWILWSGGFSFSKDFLAVDFVWIFCVSFSQFLHAIIAQNFHIKSASKFTANSPPNSPPNSPSQKLTQRRIHPAKNSPREKFTPRKIHPAKNSPCEKFTLQETVTGKDFNPQEIHSALTSSSETSTPWHLHVNSASNRRRRATVFCDSHSLVEFLLCGNFGL